jgi:hypothetical protein
LPRSAGKHLDPRTGFGAADTVGYEEAVASFREQGDRARAFVFDSERIALPANGLKAVGLQAEASALVGQVGVEIEGCPGEGEGDVERGGGLGKYGGSG